MSILSQRFKAFSWHSLVSAIVIVCIAWLVYARWYPGALPALLGVNRLIGLLSLASLLIWPALTALVIKADKREQRRDHGILWSIQAIFTIAAVYFLFASRVVWVNYSADLFEIVRHKDIVYSKNIPLATEYHVGIFEHFKWLGASFSEEEALNKQQRTEDLEGIVLAQRVDALVPIAAKQALMQRYAQPIDALSEFNTAESIAAVQKQYPQTTLWFPVKGFVRDGVVLTDENFSFFVVAPLQPWEENSL